MRSELKTTVEHTLTLTQEEVVEILDELSGALRTCANTGMLWELAAELEVMKDAGKYV